MKKTYTKPAAIKAQNLSALTADNISIRRRIPT